MKQPQTQVAPSAEFRSLASPVTTCVLTSFRTSQQKFSLLLELEANRSFQLFRCNNQPTHAQKSKTNHAPKNTAGSSRGRPRSDDPRRFSRGRICLCADAEYRHDEASAKTNSADQHEQPKCHRPTADAIAVPGGGEIRQGQAKEGRRRRVDRNQRRRSSWLRPDVLTALQNEGRSRSPADPNEQKEGITPGPDPQRRNPRGLQDRRG